MPLFRNARACLEATAARYAALSSYSDVGVAEDISKLRRPSCWFNTQFESPTLYRFQFVTAHPFWPLHQRRRTASRSGTATADRRAHGAHQPHRLAAGVAQPAG